MPSFDIVSETNMQEVDNALNSVKREIAQRYDFKGGNSSVNLENDEILIMADDDMRLRAITEMLKGNFVKRKVDPRSLDFQNVEKASGNMLRQSVKIKKGIDQETAKKITKHIKESKMKVQASIRGEEVRVDGKKRDDLQEAMAIVRAMDLPLPLQFINFRD